MRAIALAIMFLAVTRRSQQEEANMPPVAQGVLGWIGLISFVGFWVCLIGGW